MLYSLLKVLDLISPLPLVSERWAYGLAFVTQYLGGRLYKGPANFQLLIFNRLSLWFSARPSRSVGRAFNRHFADYELKFILSALILNIIYLKINP